ncbi:MAG: ferritin family protein [Desulfobacterales bacterium]|jgi:rubrerythrin|nr:ferritin family protein [Desulfobacterales bacterium]
MQDERLAGLIATAIKREEEAYDFYMGIQAKVRDDATRDTIGFVANEEKKHKAFLVRYRDGDFAADALRMSDVVFYKIAEYQEEPEVKENLESAEVFLVAAHRELRSHQFYTELATLHPPGSTKDMLLSMANEELKHKEKMEYLYANTAFPQTSGG